MKNEDPSVVDFVNVIKRGLYHFSHLRTKEFKSKLPFNLDRRILECLRLDPGYVKAGKPLTN